MKTTIAIIILIMGIIVTILLGISSAYALYEGTNQIDSGLDYISNWKIINNQSNINATQISNTSLLINVPELTSNLSFSIVFEGYLNEEEKVIIEYSSGGTHYVYKNNITYKDRNITQYVNQSVDRIVYVDKNNTITLEPPNNSTLNKWIILGIICLAILVTLMIIILVKKFKRNTFPELNQGGVKNERCNNE